MPCDSTNATFSSINLNKSYLFPLDEDENFDYCKPYAYIPNDQNECSIGDFDQNHTMDVGNCSKIIYDEFDMDSTFVTSLDLICDKQYMVALIASIYMAGNFFGSFIFGYMGDQIGRKLTLMIAILTASGGSLAGAFCTNYIAYAATRFLVAIGKCKDLQGTGKVKKNLIKLRK